VLPLSTSVRDVITPVWFGQAQSATPEHALGRFAASVGHPVAE
jgi:hypothetical protein